MSIPEFSKPSVPDDGNSAETTSADGSSTAEELGKISQDALGYIRKQLDNLNMSNLPHDLPSNSELLKFFQDSSSLPEDANASNPQEQERKLIKELGDTVGNNVPIDVSDDGKEVRISHTDGAGHADTETVFHLDNPADLSSITSFTKQDSRFQEKYEKVPGSKDLWNKISPHTGKVLNENPMHWKVETNKDWHFIQTDLDNQQKTTTTPDGKEIVENLKTGDAIEKQNGFVTRVKHDGKEISYSLDKDHKGHPQWVDGTYVKEIKDQVRNWHLTKQSDESWQVDPLNPDKAFSPPTEKFKDNAEVNDRGDYILANEDHIRQRFHADGSTEKRLGTMADLRDRINRSDILADKKDQTARILNDYLPALAERKFSTVTGGTLTTKHPSDNNREIADTVYQLSRLLDTPGNDAFPDEERAKILEQVAYHAAYPSQLAQSNFRTCNMTDIGGSILHDSPSVFAKQWADAAMQGSLHSADGTKIYLPREEIFAALAEQPFPPPDPENPATGVSRGFAMFAGNIASQRMSTDLQDNVVKRGSLVYLQGGGDKPWESIFHYKPSTLDYAPIQYGEELAAQRGTKWVNSPPNWDLSILDAYQQITGKPEAGRVLMRDEHYQGLKAENENSEAWSWFKDSLVPVKSAEHLQEQLREGPYPKILYVNAGSLISKELSDTQHLVMLTGYEFVHQEDAQARSTLDGLLVNYDDTQPKPAFRDHVKPGTGVLLRKMFEATKLYDP